MAYSISINLLLYISLIFTNLFSPDDSSFHTFLYHSGGVNSIDLSHDGNFLISGSKDETLCIWNLKTNQLEKTLKFDGTSIKRVCYNQDGTKILVGLYEQFAEIDVATLKKKSSKKNAHSSFVEACNYSNDNSLIVTSSWRDKSLVVWNGKTLKKEIALDETDVWINNAIFNKNANLVFSAGNDNLIKMWNVKTGGLIKSFAGHDDWIYDVCLSDDENTLYSGSFDKTIKVWDIKTGKNTNTLKGHTKGIVCLDMTKDGKYLASGAADSTIIIWDLSTKKEIQKLIGHTGIIMDIKFSADNKTIFSCSIDKSIKIWKLEL
jgi:WD40 repeat protein